MLQKEVLLHPLSVQDAPGGFVKSGKFFETAINVGHTNKPTEQFNRQTSALRRGGRDG